MEERLGADRGDADLREVLRDPSLGPWACGTTTTCPDKLTAWMLLPGSSDFQTLLRLLMARAHAVRSLDSQGRSLLHVASSAGRRAVVEWLVRHRGASLSQRDLESGYTALHRAVYYGQVHVIKTLVALGADLGLADREGLTPLDILSQDRLVFCPRLSRESLCEAFAWGINTNYNLGLGHLQHKANPTLVEKNLRRDFISQFTIQKFHSAAIATDGRVFTFGHGSGGRLGHGSEEDWQIFPKVVAALKNQCVTSVALGVDHSVFLTGSGGVWTCGKNTLGLLGHQSGGGPALVPKQVKSSNAKGEKLPVAEGIGASRFHSLFWTSEALYTWGLNAGQLGHAKADNHVDSIIHFPKLVNLPKSVQIQMVSCSEAAIVLLTSSGDLMAIHQYQLKKRLVERQHIPGVRRIEVIGGHLDASVLKMRSQLVTLEELLALESEKFTEGGGKDLRVFILTSAMTCVVWEESRTIVCPFLTPAVQGPQRTLDIVDMAVDRSGGMILISNLGLGYEGVFQPAAKLKAAASTASRAPPSKGTVVVAQQRGTFLNVFRSSGSLKLKRRLPGIHRGRKVSCDPKGKNFCILQATPNAALHDLPQVLLESTMLNDMDGLFSTSGDDDDDPLLDLVINLSYDNNGSEEARRYLAHSFVLASASQELASKILAVEIVENDDDDDDDEEGPHWKNRRCIEVSGIRPELFQVCVRYAYTGQFRVEDLEAAVLARSRLNSIRSQPVGPDDVEARHPAEAKRLGKSKKGTKHKSSDRTASKEGPGATCWGYSSVVPLVQEAARALGLHGLVKQLSQFMSDPAQERAGNADAARFSRKQFPELSDVVIRCEIAGGVIDADKVGSSADRISEFRAHKCVLAARLDYFRSMFSSGWLEARRGSTSLTLPFSAGVLSVLLDFVYSDRMPGGLCTSEDPEFVCQVLAAADQLLAGRLVQMCEARLAGLLTLKNASSLLQFASDYGATQLAKTACQFICHNLGALLEARALDGLSDMAMGILATYYKEEFGRMDYRRLTPLQGVLEGDVDAPPAKCVEWLESFGFTEDQVWLYEEELKKDSRNAVQVVGGSQPSSGSSSNAWSAKKLVSAAAPSSANQSSTKKRSRKTSTDSCSSLASNVTEEEHHPPEMDFSDMIPLDGSPNLDPNPPAVNCQRNFAKPVLPEEVLPYSLSLITLTPRATATNGGQIDNEPAGAVVPRQTAFRKLSKVSQKQRKAAAAGTGAPSSSSAQSSPEKSAWSGWGGPCPGDAKESPVQQQQQEQHREAAVTLAEIMRGQMSESNGAGGGPTKPTPISVGRKTKTNRKSWRSLDLFQQVSASTESSPVAVVGVGPPPPPPPASNPWKTVQESKPRRPSEDLAIDDEGTFKDIMLRERTEKDNLQRAMAKSLSATQVEEKAILELAAFYNSDSTFDEHITVDRTRKDEVLATPIWNPLMRK